MSAHALASAALDQTFLDARTFHQFTSEPVPDALLRQLYDLVKWAPTSMNCQPARYVFVRTPEGKAKLKGALSAGNVDKTLQAPVTAIVAADAQFFEHLPTQFPAYPQARDGFAKDPENALKTARYNAALQAGYLILGARMLGLDCGPMGGFDAAQVDAQFFPDGRWRSQLLINLGHGTPQGTHPRGPRLSFDEVARLA